MSMSRLKSVALVGMTLGALAWSAPAFLNGRQTDPSDGPESSRISTLRSAAPLAMMTDWYGDPLPPRARMRLGTVRYRQDRRMVRIAYSPDGRSVVTDNGLHQLQVWRQSSARTPRGCRLRPSPG
jgi:hypothetical protein